MKRHTLKKQTDGVENGEEFGGKKEEEEWEWVFETGDLLWNFRKSSHAVI